MLDALGEANFELFLILRITLTFPSHSKGDFRW